MFDKFRDEFSRARGRYIAGFVLLFLICVVCVYQISGYITFLWPGDEEIGDARKKLDHSQRALLASFNKRFKLRRHRELLKARSKELWLKDCDGEPALGMKRLIDSATEGAEFALSSVGAARSTKVADGVSLVGLSVRGKASFKSIVRFIAAMENTTPRVYWKSLLLRPVNPRRPGEILLNGYIQVVVVSDSEAARFFSGVEK
ncbi:MAG: hypothetical protein GXP32_06020 [Kiritimatiellaeota bacterium]|nr:hypothetical protein [Kiritimatiellota bacterium]